MAKEEAKADALHPNTTPQLFRHKPSKARLKKAKASASSPSPPPSSSSSSSSSPAPSMASSSSSAVPPPQPPKKSFIKRMVPFLLAANLAVGAYVLTRTMKKRSSESEDIQEETPVSTTLNVEMNTTEKTSATQPFQPIPAPVETLPPISENDQRELFKWILEEKRKVKTRDPSEKKKIDEEKAILKQYIHAESLPNL